MDANTNSQLFIRLAVLGGATNSAVGMAHISALRLTQKFTITAGCFSRDPEINYLSGVNYGLKPDQIFNTLNSLLISASFDAILILTPTDQHFDQVLECLKRNITIICEKSLAADLKELHMISGFMKNSRDGLFVIYNYLGYPMVREMREIILGNIVGKVHQIHLEMPQEGFIKRNLSGDPVEPQQWRLKDMNEIPIVSLDLGVHLHILLKFLTDKIPIEAVGTSDSFGNFKNVTDNVIGIVRLSDDVICNIWFSKSALGNKNPLKIRVFGELGSISWCHDSHENLIITDKFGTSFCMDRSSPNLKIAGLPRYNRFKAGHPSGFIEALGNYYDDIAEVIRLKDLDSEDSDSNQFVFGFDAALEGLQLLNALAKSSKTRKWESVI